MNKYTVKKGEDGKYKLIKKDVKPLNVIRAKADIDNDALKDRIKKEKDGTKN